VDIYLLLVDQIKANIITSGSISEGKKDSKLLELKKEVSRKEAINLVRFLNEQVKPEITCTKTLAQLIGLI